MRWKRIWALHRGGADPAQGNVAVLPVLPSDLPPISLPINKRVQTEPCHRNHSAWHSLLNFLMLEASLPTGQLARCVGQVRRAPVVQLSWSEQGSAHGSASAKPKELLWYFEEPLS